MIPFIDVSSHQQGPVGIDWPAVAKWLLAQHPEAGAIVKVSQGDKKYGYVNPFLHQQRMGAHAAGIRNVGLYHYGMPSICRGADEADWFMECVGNDGGVLAGEFYCFDLEDTDVPASADLDAYALDYDGRLARPFGRQIILYSAPWYLDPHNLSRDPRLADMGLWGSAPGPLQPITPEPWRSAGKVMTLWQNNWQGSVPGIVGPVDLDYLVGPIETLRPYQWGLAPTKPFDPGATDVPLDVDVPLNSQNLTDIKKVAQKMRNHLDIVAASTVVEQLPGEAALLKSEADWLVRATWGH